MSIEAISQQNNFSAQSAGSGRTGLIGNYEIFLQLLTTQLRNQSPLEPLDANQFTEQLVQYSTVEQQIQTNENLNMMLATLLASNATSLVSYVGREIEAAGSVTMLENGKAVWHYDAAADASDTVIEIRNEAGTLVRTIETGIEAGENTFTWDGKLDNGQTAPDGVYQITIKAQDDKGSTVNVDTKVVGTVTEVDMSGPEPLLRLGDIVVPLSALLAVRQQPPPPESPSAGRSLIGSLLR